jgi:hypothetical protein
MRDEPRVPAEKGEIQMLGQSPSVNAGIKNVAINRSQWRIMRHGKSIKEVLKQIESMGVATIIVVWIHRSAESGGST